LANAVFSPPPATLGALFLPNAGVGYSGFRIRRIRVYAPDTFVTTTPASAQSYAVQLVLTGKVGVTDVTNFFVGDGAAFEANGLISNERARIEIVPTTEFSNKWWQLSDTHSVPFSASTLPLAPADSVDIFLVDLLLDIVSLTT
jgi:hypothetical protein